MKKDIKETKEKILAGLEGKSYQEYIYDRFLEAQHKFIKSLWKLENFDEDCDCEEPKIATTIAEGDTHYGAEFVCVQRCLTCGGYVKEDTNE
ncbi:hypothetical protein LCGC14_2851340 [marine sediment metagenome]|uniref:Uncharacterized protein n=1 Tax=marine sediment metagenome TaxID=412755 RepID=A0A0F8Y8G1_9ZZZZ